MHHELSPLDSQGTIVMRCVKESFADKFENQQLLKEYQGARVSDIVEAISVKDE